eukprot:COSAG03_NODE_5952_length_1142_cov_3.326350_2_plen_52_part_00
MPGAQLVERAVCTLILFCAWLGLSWLLVETLAPVLEKGGYMRLEHLDGGGL